MVGEGSVEIIQLGELKTSQDTSGNEGRVLHRPREVSATLHGFHQAKKRTQSLGEVLPIRPFYRSHSRKHMRSGDIDIDLDLIDPVIEPQNHDPDDSVSGGPGSLKGEATFCTRHKLERGTLSAFKKQARNIIDRDLPHISHKDNIIKVFTHKGQSHLWAVATKGKWFSIRQLGKFKYYFQHPYLRLFVSYIVILCNLLIFAEDPVSHSKREADIPVFGNVFSFIFIKYPTDWRFQILKVFMWLLAIICGLIVGKTLIHGIILSRFLRLKMFRADQGSWMVQFFTVILSLFLFSHAYNVLLVLTLPNGSKALTITSKMYFSHSSVMKAAACGTWLGCLITALIITDMMLQDNLYPEWAPRLRALWKKHWLPRILLFWVGSVLVTAVVVTIIATDWISWDRLNRNFFATSELSRAFLASFILVLDLTIVMQDWDFPHFTNTLDVNLPGFHRHEISFQAVEIEISGKWFNYGIIFLVMLFDLNMLKNQIFYYPAKYGQYIGIQNRVFTVTNQTILQTNDPQDWSYEARALINSETGLPFINEDLSMYSTFMAYSMGIKSIAFLPCILGFVTFFVLVGVYGRISDTSSLNNRRKVDL